MKFQAIFTLSLQCTLILIGYFSSTLLIFVMHWPFIRNNFPPVAQPPFSFFSRQVLPFPSHFIEVNQKWASKPIIILFQDSYCSSVAIFTVSVRLAWPILFAVRYFNLLFSLFLQEDRSNLFAYRENTVIERNGDWKFSFFHSP